MKKSFRLGLAGLICALSQLTTLTVVGQGSMLQTISVSPIDPQRLTDGSFEVTAIASSGFEVQLEVVVGAASVLGNTVFLDGFEGPITLKASQPGDGTYAPAPAGILRCSSNR